ncbi:hypothetical protein SNL152K_2511 [Streptomyces sp. NL15-2K]|nr:hypothetical protein SNL152K_2511 [Streptomyces sp. NL15-2K]
MDPHDPAARRRVVPADGEQHVPGERDLLQPLEQLERGRLRLGQGRRVVDRPAGAVVVDHVRGQQPAPRGGDPAELRRELHPLRIPRLLAEHRQRRPPLVERPARPRTGGDARVRHQPRELRIVPEGVQLPGGFGRGSQDRALEAVAVESVADGRLGAGEVGVGLVVGAAHDLDAAGADQLPQEGPLLGEGVPVRLEVVDLREHEGVRRVAPRQIAVRPHQAHPGLAARVEGAGGQAGGGGVVGDVPGLGVGGLGVPPDGVVVEVADHEHRPAGFGDGELSGVVGESVSVGGGHRDLAALAGSETVGRHGYLGAHGAVVGRRRLCLTGEAGALDREADGPAGSVAQLDGHHLARLRGGSDEKLGRLDRSHAHGRGSYEDARRGPIVAPKGWFKQPSSRFLGGSSMHARS